jgi:hypothetical protein
MLVGGMPILLQSTTLQPTPWQPGMQRPSAVHGEPSLQVPPAMHSASHRPSGEQWNPAAHVSGAPGDGSHVVEHAAGGGF